MHAQLLTRTKAFCSCSTAFGAAPNTNVCPTCLGLPGALPVLNGEAVRLAVRTALGLGCELRSVSRFSRAVTFTSAEFGVEMVESPGQAVFAVKGTGKAV